MGAVAHSVAHPLYRTPSAELSSAFTSSILDRYSNPVMKSSYAASFWRHTYIPISFQAPQTNETPMANAIPFLGMQFKEIVNPAFTFRICGPPEFFKLRIWNGHFDSYKKLVSLFCHLFSHSSASFIRSVYSFYSSC